MFGEVKLGEADYTLFWETLLFMWNILCQISWEKAFWSLQPLQGFLLLENMKTFTTNVFFADKIKPGTYVNQHV